MKKVFSTLEGNVIVSKVRKSKISGRKLTIDDVVTGIASYAIFFAIPGLVTFSILLWYLKNRGKMKTRFRSH